MNPIGAIPAAEMMDDWLGEAKIECRIENASCLSAEPYAIRTGDMVHAVRVCARVRERKPVLHAAIGLVVRARGKKCLAFSLPRWEGS